jgi:hypothetical protein
MSITIKQESGKQKQKEVKQEQTGGKKETNN